MLAPAPTERDTERGGEVLMLMITGTRIEPTVEGLPGWDAVKHLADQIGGVALMLAVLGVVIGAAAWARGPRPRGPPRRPMTSPRSWGARPCSTRGGGGPSSIPPSPPKPGLRWKPATTRPWPSSRARRGGP